MLVLLIFILGTAIFFAGAAVVRLRCSVLVFFISVGGHLG
jgi:hypothetical protein